MRKAFVRVLLLIATQSFCSGDTFNFVLGVFTIHAFFFRNNQTAWNALVDLNTEDYLFYKHALLMADFQYKRLKNTSGHMKGKSNYFPTYKPVDDKPHNLESGEFNSDENRTFCSFDEK